MLLANWGWLCLRSRFYTGVVLLLQIGQLCLRAGTIKWAVIYQILRYVAREQYYCQDIEMLVGGPVMLQRANGIPNNKHILLFACIRTLVCAFPLFL